ncbi:MAG: phosphoribosylanthranilate isomerase [Bacteroidota bacterium]
MKLKVCGMKYNIAEVAELQSDYLGFIFWERSPRYFNGEIPKLPQGVKKVGVFVNATLHEVLLKVQQYQLDALQLHGKESPEYCKTLQERLQHTSIQNKGSGRANNDGVEIIKVFSIREQFDFSVLRPYEAVCDYFLFDSKGKLPGGNGYRFNWEVLKSYPSTKPYFLSGGIGLENSTELQAFLNHSESKYCYALDINSRFEEQPGLKEIKQLQTFKKLLEHELSR